MPLPARFTHTREPQFHECNPVYLYALALNHEIELVSEIRLKICAGQAFEDLSHVNRLTWAIRSLWVPG